MTETLAVLRRDTEVRQENIDVMAWLSKWINYDFNKVQHSEVGIMHTRNKGIVYVSILP